MTEPTEGAPAPIPGATPYPENPLGAIARAFEAGLNRGAPVMIHASQGDAVALPEGYLLEELDDNLLAKPRRLAKKLVLLTPADVIAYTNRFKSENSVIFIGAEPQDGEVCARVVLDYHAPGPDGQSWCEHEVALMFRMSWQFRALLALCNQQQEQAKFALALREIAPFCQSMASADVLELAQTLALTSKGSYRSSEDEFSGSVDFVYNVTVNASAGTSADRRLAVPQKITWTLPLLLGGEALPVETDFTYAVPSNPQEKVRMGLRLNRQKEILQALSDSIRKELVEGTQLPAYLSE